MPQIGMGGVPQVKVGVVGRAMQLVGNHTYFCAFASCNCLTVTGTIILKLHSNVCDYLYE